jgi:hypothetical protein
MSTPNFGRHQSLTENEQILHYYAAMFKKDLDACRTESGRKRRWKRVFKNHLAHYFSDPPVLCTFLTLIQALAMQFYVQAEKRDPDKPI